MADRSLSRPRPAGAAKSPPAASAGAPASVKAPSGVGAPAKATRAELALDRGRAAIVSLLACVVRARGRLSEADARTLCRHELPGKAFDLAQALAVDNGYLLALDGMCLVVTAAGRLLPGVMPPTARQVRLVEGASWEHPDGPPAGDSGSAEAPTVYQIAAGADLLHSIPKGLVRAMIAGRVSGGELDRLASVPREVVVSGGNVVVRRIVTAQRAITAQRGVAPQPAPTFTLAPPPSRRPWRRRPPCSRCRRRTWARAWPRRPGRRCIRSATPSTGCPCRRGCWAAPRSC
jgi:hypothetical protein